MPIDGETDLLCDCGECRQYRLSENSRYRLNDQPNTAPLRAGYPENLPEFLPSTVEMKTLLPSITRCPLCSSSNYFSNEDFVYNNGVWDCSIYCLGCGTSFDFSLDHAILEIALSDFRTPKGSRQLSKVFITHKGKGDNFQILSAYTYASSASLDTLRYSDLEYTAFDICPKDKPSFPVFIITVGSGSDYRIHSVTTDKGEAHGLAKDLGGRILAREVTPERRTRMGVTVYVYFVNFDQDNEVDYNDSRTRRIKMFKDEPTSYTVTRRRRYRSCLPNRFEVQGVDKRKTEELALELSKYTEQEISMLYEYNVDYKFTQNESQWERDIPCQVAPAP